MPPVKKAKGQAKPAYPVKLAKYQDPNYVSEQPYETKHIINTFTTAKGEQISAVVVKMALAMMKLNHTRVLRTDFYKVLELLGYKQKGK